MKFNVNKCCVIHCRRLNRNIDYKLYGQKIRVTESEKDLGVIINNDMKFKDQVASAAKKPNTTLGMIKRNFEYIKKETFCRVAWHVSETTFRIYCASMVTISDWFKRKMRAITRRATQLVRNIKHTSYEERLSTLNLMLTLDRQDRGVLNHRVEMDARFMKMNTESRTRGHTKKLKVS